MTTYTLDKHPHATRDLPPTGDGRHYVTPLSGQIVLTDDWQEITLEDGTTVEVRSKDCGLDCRCAGEYR